MAVPKRKHSNSRSNKRRSHDFLTSRQLSPCKACGHPIPSHTVCPQCGIYLEKDRRFSATGDE
ncbi:MAG: 50S ribosomal protein L32 [Pirellulaceae bacterium]|nr:50S ribosomal protein L32 [Planctomycetaceae bacterium]MDB4864658.1 50S ribosomal protein L32 [Pirellulaceae bacterium]